MPAVQSRGVQHSSIERFFQFSLLGMLASGFLALVGSGYLDLTTTILTSAALVIRTFMILEVWSVPISDRTATAATLVYLGFYPLDYLYLSKDFVQATVHLICFLAGAKLLTARATRDYRHLKVLALLELLAACILSASLNFFIFLVLFLVFGVATFASSEIRSSCLAASRSAPGTFHSFHARLGGLTIWTAVGIVVMTSGLFFLLPRTARAAFQHLVPERYHVAGFSNEVRLGQIGEISKRSTTVMHVRAEDPAALANLKWRGAALGDFDGKRWFNRSGGEALRVEGGMVTLVPLEQRRRKGIRSSYSVQTGSLGSNALFYPGIPEFLHIRAPVIVRNSEGALRLMSGYSDSIRYSVHSFFADPGTEPLPIAPLTADEQKRYLTLPDMDPRVVTLALQITAPYPSAESQSQVLQEHLKKEYGYTTELLSSEVSDPIAHFLFERRKGHCEYFASSMALMLRAVGIPSRVITGFHGGTYNPVGGWLLIRASDAHSWVEAWSPRKGWMTFDPTPPDPNPPVANAWTKLALYLDAAEVFWQDWILNYNFDQQVTLAGKVEESSRSFRGNWFDRLYANLTAWARNSGEASDRTTHILVAGIVALLLAFAILSRARGYHFGRLRKKALPDREATILYARLLRMLARRGVHKPAWLTPREFARVLPAWASIDLVNDFTSAYYDLRFGGNLAAAGEMIRLLEILEQEPVTRS